LQYEDNSTYENKIVSNCDNFIASRDYDRTITAVIQSKQYHESQNEEVRRGEKEENKTKVIMVVDDDPDTTLTFKISLEAENYDTFHVYTYNYPELALSEFKPNFYNLLLIDINMPKMNGFELSTKILEIDANPKICFMSSAKVNHEALREIYPAINIGCFIKKPVSPDQLVRIIKTELE
jgi:DNA-binding NtrC family response regulator